jgi:hypothetical protein
MFVPSLSTLVDEKAVQQQANITDQPSLYIKSGDRTQDCVGSSNPQPISGPSWGLVNVTYTFSFAVTNPEGDLFYVLWIWGDGTDTGWEGPFDSGEIISASHAWAKKGVYEIVVKLKDMAGQVNESEPFTIHIYELRRAIIFLPFDHLINMTTQDNFTTAYVNNIYLVLLKPFAFHHYIKEINITYVADMNWGIISRRILLAGVNLVDNLSE